MVTWQKIISIMFIGFFVGGIILVVKDDTINSELKANIMAQASGDPATGLLFVKSLDLLTPTYKKPFTDGERSKLPMYSWGHLIGTIFVVGIVTWVLKKFDVSRWWILLIVLLLIVVMYFVMTGILYLIFYGTAQDLGVSDEESKLLIEEFNKHTGTFMAPALIFSVFIILSIIKIIFESVKDDD